MARCVGEELEKPERTSTGWLLPGSPHTSRSVGSSRAVERWRDRYRNVRKLIHRPFLADGLKRRSSVARYTKVACIGPITANTARELGIRVDIVASEHTIPGLVQALVESEE